MYINSFGMLKFLPHGIPAVRICMDLCFATHFAPMNIQADVSCVASFESCPITANTLAIFGLGLPRHFACNPLLGLGPQNHSVLLSQISPQGEVFFSEALSAGIFSVPTAFLKERYPREEEFVSLRHCSSPSSIDHSSYSC